MPENRPCTMRSTTTPTRGVRRRISSCSTGTAARGVSGTAGSRISAGSTRSCARICAGSASPQVPDDLETGLNVETYIDDLLAIIGELGGAPIHYCGESLGGILGMVLAAQHPQKLRTLSLVAAPLLINQDTQRAFAFDHPTWQDALQGDGLATMGGGRKLRDAVSGRDRPRPARLVCGRNGQVVGRGPDPHVTHRIGGRRDALHRSHPNPDARPLSGSMRRSRSSRRSRH